MLPVVELGLMPPRQRRFDIRTEEERQDDKIEAINRRIAELLAGNFNPEKRENVIEALDNLSDEQKEIQAAYVISSKVNVTHLLRHWVFQYWELRAEERAIDELTQTQN